MQSVRLLHASVHPPVLSSDAETDGATELPWVLLECKAHIADRRNATTAYWDSDCGKQIRIQVTFCFTRPPGVSYLCVFCRSGRDEDHTEKTIVGAPMVISTEGNLVLLRINFSTSRRDVRSKANLYIYRPGGHEGPSLTLLEIPSGDGIFRSNEVGLLRCRGGGGDDNYFYMRPCRALEDKSYMVAALCEYSSDPGRGRFVLYLYNSKHDEWTTTIVSLEDHQLQQYQKEGFFLHINTKVIAIGGEYDTIGFVDLWRGILLCDLRQVHDNPKLRYIPLPEEIIPDEPIFDDARLSRDIAVVKGRIKCIRQVDHSTKEDTWIATSWSRTSSLEDTWQIDSEIESLNMDVNNPQYELLPKPQGDICRPVPPFKGLSIMQPTLSLHNGDANVFFTVKINYDDAKAWVIVVDMKEIQGVVEFDAKRYTIVGFAYLHSRISKYLNLTSASGAATGILKRRRSLSEGSCKKILLAASLEKHFPELQDSERDDGDKMDLE